MLKLGILLPEKEMIDDALDIVEKAGENVICCRQIKNDNTIEQARKAVADGAQVIMARGYQASLIREYVDVPLAEVKLTTQDIGLLAESARELTGKESPHIAIVAFSNMLPDLTYAEKLFRIRLVTYFVDTPEEISSAVDSIDEKGKADIVIGGYQTCEIAGNRGYKTLFYMSSREAIVNAFEIANSMLLAIYKENQSRVQLETALDTSFNGMLRINTDMKIFAVNHQIEDLFGKKRENIVGKSLEEIFPQIDLEIVSQVLSGERDSYAISVNINNSAWMMVAAPIAYMKQITGAILSIHRINSAPGKEKRKEKSQKYEKKGAFSFKNIETSDKEYKQQLENAAFFALSDAPVLIYAGAGSETEALARAIHNNSDRSMEEFRMMTSEEFEFFINSEKNEKGLKGSLFLEGIDSLSLYAQSRLFKLISDSCEESAEKNTGNIRLIAASEKNLKPETEEGRFYEKLYYSLNALTIKIPALNRRAADLENYFYNFCRTYMKKYNRRLKLTKEAIIRIRNLEWQGNELQLKRFTERLILGAAKRTIDEGTIQKLYDELYPRFEKSNETERLVVYKDPEAIRLREILDKYRGNRSEAAKELGISMTTLWRKMKKYGVEAKY
ncbi:MAG: PrpR N-terminal domain-containing protein [Lachnospiraceae bacterium]|nr:PrpR N-terminal domain-containing protein [Lachnospiraceae bacterium]